MIRFILGGAQSGKTRFALLSARDFPPKRIYIATGLPIDDEMREKIEKHKKERGADFDTWEEPLYIQPLLNKIDSTIKVVVFDCITTWVANMMLNNEDPFPYIGGFLDKVSQFDIPFYFISNEVGMGIVPSNSLSRRYREVLGKINILFAQEAEEVYFMISGIPWKIK